MNLLRLKPRIIETSANQPQETAVHLGLLWRNVIIETALGIAISARRRLPGRHTAGAPRSARLAVLFSLGLERSRQGAKGARRIRPRADWAAIGVVALGAALVRRRRRIVATVIALARWVMRH